MVCVGLPLAFLQVYGTATTSQAVFRIAVLCLQVQQGLAVGRMFRRDTCMVPIAGDVVLFWRDLREKLDGHFAEEILSAVASVGKQGGANGVDDEQVDAFLGKTV